MGNRPSLSRCRSGSAYTVDAQTVQDTGGDSAFTLAAKRALMVFPNDADALHTRTIKSVCVDGSHVFLGSWDRTASMWELDTGEFVRSFHGHRQDIIGIHAADGYLFTCGDCVRMWDVRTGAQIAAFGSKDEHTTATFYCAQVPLPGLIACAFCRGAIQVYDYRPPGEMFRMRLQRGSVPATQYGLRPGTVLEGHSAGVMGMAVGVIGSEQVLASASIDRTARLWSMRKGASVRTFSGHTAPLRDVKIHAGKIYTASLDMTAREWDAMTGACLHVFDTHESPVRALVVVGRTLFTAEAPEAASATAVGASRAVREFDLGSGEQVACHKELHGAGIFHLYAPPSADRQSTTIITASADRLAKRWRLRPRAGASTPAGADAALAAPEASAQGGARERTSAGSLGSGIKPDMDASDAEDASESESSASVQPSPREQLAAQPVMESLQTALSEELPTDKVTKVVELTRAKLAEMEEASRCCVCLERPKNAALVPCGHQACRRCAEHFRANTCPVCRQPVTDVLALYG